MASPVETALSLLRFHPRSPRRSGSGYVSLDALRRSVGHPLRVAVARFDGIGDWVLTLPLIQALERSEDVASVDLVGPPAWRSLLERPGRVGYVSYTRGTILQPPFPGGTLGKVKAASFVVGREAYRDGRALQGTYDLVVLPRWDTDLGQNARIWAAGTSECVIGFDPAEVPGCTWIERREVGLLQGVIGGTRPAVHELRHLSVMMAALGLPTHIGRAFGREYFGLKMSSTRDIVVIHPLSNEPKRQWPLRMWGQLLREIVERTELNVEVIGSASEGDQLQPLTAIAPGRIKLRVGEPLGDLPRTLSGAAAFVGNDSGPAHIAGAIDVPTIVISPHPRDGDPAHRNSPVRFSPASSHLWVLQPEHGLGKCSGACSASHAHCITQITAAEAASALFEGLRVRGYRVGDGPA